MVAFSGGMDSTLLLALAAAHAPAGAALSALHVNHGLQPQAADWEEHCRSFCARLEVPLAVRRARLSAAAPALEERARNARLCALAACGADAVLLAHHADDQAETFLLRALRGSGPRGLAAMREVAGLPGCPGAAMLRPLLAFGRDELRAHARRMRLEWVEDASNAQDEPNRNWLRNVVLAEAAGRFPGASGALAAAAGLQCEAAGLLDALAGADEGACKDREGALSAVKLSALGADRVRNWLAWSLRRRGLEAPSGGQLREAARQMCAAPRGGVRQRFGNSELRCAKGLAQWRTIVCRTGARRS